jgi:4-amino-4-deoxy-L-arabinose transferase-like glycosyltransferase
LRNALRHKALVVAVIAFAFRAGFLAIFPGLNYYDGISRSYLEVATNVLAGEGFVTYVNIAPISSPTPQWSYEPFIDRPLGYLLLILLPLIITVHPIGVQILHALLSSFSAVFLLSVGKRIASERAAWRAAVIYALWPLSARFEVTILPDAVMSFFLLLTILLLLKAVASPQNFRGFFLAGIACGVGMTMRPDIMLLPLFIVAWLFFSQHFSKWIRASLTLLFGVAVIVGAQTARNEAATEGKIVPLGLGNGISLWEGISQFGDTLGTVHDDRKLAEQEGYSNWAYPDGVDRERKRFSEALDIIVHHPLWYCGVMLKRLPVLLTPDWIMSRRFAPSLKEFLDASPQNSVGAYLSTYPAAVLVRGLLVVLQYSLLLLAAWALWKKRRERVLDLPALIIFYYIVVHIPTNTEARYFYPAVPFLILLASVGWDALKQKQS